jgi:hypothetical protein
MSEWASLTRHGSEGANIFAAHQPTHPFMNDATKRSILRWIHLIFGIPIIGYIYSPFEVLPNYAPVVRYVAFPAILLSGLWMWKGHFLGRLISKRST